VSRFVHDVVCSPIDGESASPFNSVMRFKNTLDALVACCPNISIGCMGRRGLNVLKRHIWNRLHDCLFVRETAAGEPYGADTIDPLLWDRTTHLLSGAPHTGALVCLDEFLKAHAERSERSAIGIKDRGRCNWPLSRSEELFCNTTSGQFSIGQQK
jgi:hypothetical protein